MVNLIIILPAFCCGWRLSQSSKNWTLQRRLEPLSACFCLHQLLEHVTKYHLHCNYAVRCSPSGWRRLYLVESWLCEAQRLDWQVRGSLTVEWNLISWTNTKTTSEGLPMNLFGGVRGGGGRNWNRKEKVIYNTIQYNTIQYKTFI